MSYALHQTEGIVLSHWPRGEADRALWLYTERYGGVTLHAKGVRLEKSKLRGDMDMFCRTAVGFVAGKEVYRLTHAQTVNAYPRLRTDYDRYRAAGYVRDSIRAAIADGEADSGVWRLISTAFLFLNSDAFKQEYTRMFLYAFELQLLDCLGYLPKELPYAAHALMEAPAFLPVEPLTERDREEVSAFLQLLIQYTPKQHVFIEKYAL